MVPAPGLPAAPLTARATAIRATHFRALIRRAARAARARSRRPGSAALRASLAGDRPGSALSAGSRSPRGPASSSSACARRIRAATELEYRSPYQLLVSVILSAQATDRSVNLATAAAVSRSPAHRRRSPRSANEGLAPLHPHDRTVASKAKNVIAATRRSSLARHGGEVPRERAALEALPGVGRKTANVVMNTAFGEPTIAVDTHIFRVANRTGLAPGSTVREVEDRAVAVVPEEFRRDAHHWLILHGRYVCKARKPECPTCVIADLCEFPHKAPADATPAMKPAGRRPRL